MIREYLRLITFTAGLLMGIQVPGFIDQYQKRVDAHLQEANKNISGFQLTANRFFNGNIDALITHYKASTDPVFQRDAASITHIYQRLQMLQAEADIFNKRWYQISAHVAGQYRSTLFQETLAQFSHTIPLTGTAILWGVSVALCLSIIIDFLLFVLTGIGRKVRYGRKATA